jgi:hypothetical protein
LNGKRAQKRKANIQETLAEASEPIFSLSFPNPGGKAVAGHALASPGIPLSCKKELIVGAKARRICFNFTSFPPIVKKKIGSLFSFGKRSMVSQEVVTPVKPESRSFVTV